MRRAWKALIESYLAGDPGPCGVVHLVDARHEPTDLDREMVEYLGELALPMLLVLTKIDKVPRGKRENLVHGVSKELGVDPGQIVPFSSKTGEGREELLEAVEALLEESNETG